MRTVEETKERIYNWICNNAGNTNKAQCSRETGLPKTTVRRHFDRLLEEKRVTDNLENRFDSYPTKEEDTDGEEECTWPEEEASVEEHVSEDAYFTNSELEKVATTFVLDKVAIDKESRGFLGLFDTAYGDDYVIGSVAEDKKEVTMYLTEIMDFVCNKFYDGDTKKFMKKVSKKFEALHEENSKEDMAGSYFVR